MMAFIRIINVIICLEKGTKKMLMNQIKPSYRSYYFQDNNHGAFQIFSWSTGVNNDRA